MSTKRLLTPQVQHLVCAAIARGHSKHTIHRIFGFSKSMISRWLAEGRQDLREHFENPTEKPLTQLAYFCRQIENAEFEFKRIHIEHIQKCATEPRVVEKSSIKRHADGSITEERTREVQPASWQASKWLLEQKYPDEFGTRLSVTADNKNPTQRPVQLNIQFLPTESESNEDAG